MNDHLRPEWPGEAQQLDGPAYFRLHAVDEPAGLGQDCPLVGDIVSLS
jgi:hypothetical protein